VHSPVRNRLLDLVAGLVPVPRGENCVRVGVDGVDGAGKTCFADELAGAGELSIFLDVGFAETARRMAGRDGSEPDPEHPSLARYVLAQRRYLADCRPREQAGIVIDNTVLAAPVLVSLTPGTEPI
jgi:hypothetical protein